MLINTMFWVRFLEGYLPGLNTCGTALQTVFSHFGVQSYK